MLATTSPAVKLQTYSTPEQAGCAQSIDRSLTIFWTLVERLRSAADQQQPIHQVEEAIFRDLLAMGRDLLQAFLALSGDGDVGPSLTIPGDSPADPPQVLPRLDQPRRRPYLSIFGEVDIARICYGHDRVEAAPLDARLHLPRRAVFVLVPAVARGVRGRRCSCRGDQETPDDPGVEDLGQSLGGPQPRAGQRRGAVPEPPADTRSDGGGTDPGGDGRLQRGALGAQGACRRRSRPTSRFRPWRTSVVARARRRTRRRWRRWGRSTRSIRLCAPPTR